MTRAPGEWLTVREAARRFGISGAAVRRAICEGRIPSERDQRGVTIIQAWRAAELWERFVFQREGLRRCEVCLEVKPLEEFSRIRQYRRHLCLICHRKKARRLMTKWLNTKRGRELVDEWYVRRGGRTAYHKARRLARRLGQVVKA
jgi:excisionase family DNA binding protein